ncbi:hypothetical protein R50073_17930 [Maricurvus nonylphenolicus]|uniref:hypothetical protein n=1 Tax=Maricurvus nonylphenolicus TaxID=1008307 RepID=UPI0036F3DA57
MITSPLGRRVCCLCMGLMAFSAFAADPVSGHQPLQIWDDEARNNLPAWVQVWLTILKLAILPSVFFAWKYVEARWVLASIVAGVTFSNLIAPQLGLLPLAGLTSLTHVIFWTPAIVVLIKNRPFMQGFSLYNAWAAFMLACMLFSFVFDIPDAWTYLGYQLQT